MPTTTDASTRLKISEATLNFRTDRLWTARDLSSFIDTVELMYGIFLSYYIFDRSSDYSVGFFLQLSPPTVFEYDPTRLPRILSQGWSTKARFSNLPIATSPITDNQEGTVELIILDTLNSGVYRRWPQSALSILRIQMSSPGFITFKGLGEPIREIRELIKDFWYRNRQEKARGDIQLEALQLYLSHVKSMKDLRDPEIADQTLFLLSRSAHHIARMEADGRLPNLSDFGL